MNIEYILDLLILAWYGFYLFIFSIRMYRERGRACDQMACVFSREMSNTIPLDSIARAYIDFNVSGLSVFEPLDVI